MFGYGNAEITCNATLYQLLCSLAIRRKLKESSFLIAQSLATPWFMPYCFISFSDSYIPSSTTDCQAEIQNKKSQLKKIFLQRPSKPCDIHHLQW